MLSEQSMAIRQSGPTLAIHSRLTQPPVLRSAASSGVEVLGSAVQQDGPSASLTAPNGSSQRRLIESVSRGLIDKNDSSSLEAHGTGTALGDPIEVFYCLLLVL